MNSIIENIPKLLKASILTIELTLISLIIGIFIGLFFAILRLSKHKLLFSISYYYSFVFRGTPLLVQIFIIYFGLAQLEFIRESFLWFFLKKPFACAILAFSLNTGAYTSEIFRSGFEKVDKSIIEAANALGIPNFWIFIKIKLPIAIKQSLPAYGNEMILMLKGTSLASTITLIDLTGAAKHIISTNFNPVEVFIFVGSIYLFFTFLIHNLIKFTEKKMRHN
jgi:octopine/nopaline transport system permease protein|tara:strand:- start:495 stop:1163 length:669 start_codon:yes stop_codon:yes gene_type:complete